MVDDTHAFPRGIPPGYTSPGKPTPSLPETDSKRGVTGIRYLVVDKLESVAGLRLVHHHATFHIPFSGHDVPSDIYLLAQHETKSN